MKKVGLLVAVLCLSMFVVAGCSGGTTSSSAASSASTASSSSASKSSSSSMASSSSSATAKNPITIDSVETQPEAHYDDNYVAYVMDVKVRNVSGETKTFEYIDVTYLDANGDIVDTGVGFVGNDGVKLANDQAASFDVVVNTGRGITQMQITGVVAIENGERVTYEFSDPSKYTYDTISPSGTAD